MLLILFTWLVFWTPMASILNFLIDLNLMRVSSVINQGADGLNIANNRAILKEVASISSILNYMAILIPTLAFALVKGSEYALVSAFSQLTGASSGAARSAATFSNQQALSTESKISAPKTDIIGTHKAGLETYESAVTAIGGGQFEVREITNGRTNIKDANSDSQLIMNQNGTADWAKISGLDVKTTQAETQTRQENLANAMNDNFTTGFGRNVIADYTKTLGANTDDAKTIEKTEQQAVQEALKDVFGEGSKFSSESKAKISAGLGIKIGEFIDLGGEISKSGASMSEVTKNMTKEEAETFQKMVSEKRSASVRNNDDVASAYSNLISSSTSKDFSSLKSYADSYLEAKSLSNSVSVDGGARIINAYANENLGYINDEKERHATALKEVESIANRGDMQSILKYADMDTTAPSKDGLQEVGNKNYYDPASVGAQAGRNNDTVASNQNKNMVLGTDAQDKVKDEANQQGLSGKSLSDEATNKGNKLEKNHNDSNMFYVKTTE